MKQTTEINPADYAKYWWLTLIVGGVLAGLGLVMFLNPNETIAFKIMLLGIMWLVSGIFEIVGALFTHRRNRRILAIVMGIFSITLGFFALNNNLTAMLFGNAAWLTAIAIGVLVMGILYIAIALKGSRRTLILGILNVIIGAGLLFFPDSLGGIMLFVIAGLILVAGAVLIWYSFWLRRQDEPAPAAERLNH